MKRVLWSCMAPMVLLSGCVRDLVSPPPMQSRVSAASGIDVSDPRGELIVEVRYAGAYYASAAPIADNDCQLLVDVNVPTWSGNAVRFCEQTRTTVISPGTFSSRPWIYDGYMYPTLAANIPVVVTAGQTTRQVYDLATMTGLVEGTVLVDGVAASSAYSVCLSTGGCTNFTRGGGAFRLITKPGDGSGVIRNNLGNQLGSFTYTALLGQTVAVARQEVTDPRGTLVVEAKYGGRFHDPSAPIADNECQLLIDVSVPSWSGNAVRFCERRRTTVVVPGTYPSRPWIYDGYVYPTLVQNVPVTVVNGQTTTQEYDFESITGIVRGRVTVDGQPAGAQFSVCLSTGGCTNFMRGDGTFVLVTRPGSGSAVIRNNTGNTLGTFAYVATAGQSTQVPDQGVSDPRGDLEVQVRYEGRYHDAGSPVADNDCEILVDVGVPTWSGNAVRFCERNRRTTVVPGTYWSRPWIYDGYVYPTLVQNIPVTVVNGQLTTQVYEIAAMTSIVTGTVMVDGKPASSAYRVCLSTGGCSRFPRGDGTFRILTKPGSGTGAVWNNIGVLLTRFEFTSTAGETIPVGTIGGDNTPPVITPTVTGPVGADGWYTGDVSVSFAVADAESPVTASGCEARSITTNTAGVTYECTATSAGGTSSRSVVVKRDAAVPAVVPQVSGTPGTDGWYVSDVVVSWAISAPGPSGITADCAARTLATDTPGVTYSCTATTGAGSSRHAAIVVKRDAAPPVIAFTGNAGIYTVDQLVDVKCAVTDAMSGVASHRCEDTTRPAYELPVGTTTLVANAVDRAGNRASETTAFTVSVTPASLCTLVTRWSNKSGVAHAMCQTLRNGAFDAFRNQVRAQSDKAIGAAQAELLLRLADHI